MPRPYSQSRGEEERASDERRGQALERQLAGEITGVATTYVDHSGAARVKAVPLSGLARAARSGLGFSPVIDAFTSDGGIDAASPLDSPDGDLRMVPDLDRLAVLPAPGVAAVVTGRLTQRPRPTRNYLSSRTLSNFAEY